MIDLNHETILSTLRGLEVLCAIQEIDPNYSINLRTFCLQANIHLIDDWSKNLIGDYLFTKCKVEENVIEGDELIEALTQYYSSDICLEFFLDSDEYQDFIDENDQYADLVLTESNIKTYPDLYNRFLEFLKEMYNIVRYSISSPFLDVPGKELDNFMDFFLFYIYSHLDIYSGDLLFQKTIFNKDTNNTTLILDVDTSSDCSFDDFFSTESTSDYVKPFVDYIKAKKNSILI